MLEEASAFVSDVDFICADAHDLPLDDASFDAVTALQCWVYFDKEKLLPELHRILKTNGFLYVIFLTWLPNEDKIIRKSLELVKHYNPDWSGFMKRFGDQADFHWLNKDFSLETVMKQDYHLPFSKEAWCDRMIASRGIGATLSENKISEFRSELTEILSTEDEKFTVLHEGENHCPCAEYQNNLFFIFYCTTLGRIRKQA